MAADPLGDAVAALQAEVDAFKPGTTEAPGDGTAPWYRLRALSAGLSMLKSMRAYAGDPAAEERFFRDATRALKAGDPELNA